MTHIVKEEYEKYDLNSCNVMYIPLMGFLFVISNDSFRQASSDITAASSLYQLSDNSVFMDTGEQVNFTPKKIKLTNIFENKN